MIGGSVNVYNLVRQITSLVVDLKPFMYISSLLNFLCTLFKSQLWWLGVGSEGLHTGASWPIFYTTLGLLRWPTTRDSWGKYTGVNTEQTRGVGEGPSHQANLWPVGDGTINKCFSFSHSPYPLPKWMVLKYISYGYSEISGFKLQPSDTVANSIRQYSMGSLSFPSSPPFFHSWDHDSQMVLTCKHCLELCGNPTKSGNS